MRKSRSMLFFIAFLLVCTAGVLVFCAIGRADNSTDVTKIWELRKLAQNSEKSPAARVAPVEDLGNFRPTNDPVIQKALRDVFRELLNDPQGPEFAKNYVRFYVVRALGKIASRMDVSELKAALDDLKSTDENLNHAIDETRKEIDRAQAKLPPLPLPGLNAQEKTIESLIDILLDDGKLGIDKNLRILAAQQLGSLGSATKLGGKKDAAQKALGKISATPPDPVLKCAADEALKQIN